VFEPTKNQKLPPHAFCNGLIITDQGQRGLVIETTPMIHMSVRRHERVMEFIDTCLDAPPGGRLLMLLIVNELVLHFVSLKAAVSKAACNYAAGDLKYLEWTTDGGWLERRKLSPQTAAAVEDNGGSVVSTADWQWATAVLRELHPDRPSNEAWQGFLADAQAWWFGRVTGPIFGHVIRLRPFQLLNRAALARLESGRPQLSIKAKVDNGISLELELVQTVRSQSKIISTFDELIVFTGQIARAKGSKENGRALIVEHIKMMLPLAAREGRVQVIVLGGTRHAIEMGGIHGDKWAPVTIYEYIRQGLKELVIELLEADIDDLDGWQWLTIYQGILKKIPESQKGKFAAFLEAYHRYLVIAGFDPLPHSLSGRGLTLPPAAAVVWPHELVHAVNYVSAHAPSMRIRLQASLGLVLGFHIPTRTVELWCLRLRDLHLDDENVYVTIYTRRRDGVGKTPNLRRQEDVLDLQLKTMLIEMDRLRRDHDYADDDDLLLGEPGKTDARHEEMVTTRLMNAALRWATGNPIASFYDLRHSAFSRRAAPVLAGDETDTDVASFVQVSAQGGHGGPNSTSAYIHITENVIAELSHESRPQSHDLNVTGSGVQFVFEDVGKGLLSIELPPLEYTNLMPEQDSASSLNLARYADIIWRVSQNLPIPAVAGACDVSVPAVQKVITDMAQTLVLAGIVGYQAAGSFRKQCLTINAKALWARAARQPKNDSIKKSLADLVSAGQWSKLQMLWRDWIMCRHGDDLSMSNPRPAARIIEFLLGAGVSRESLIFVSATDAPPMPTELIGLKIDTRRVKARPGRPAHRLFMSKRGLKGRSTSGATISMMGFHWLMLLIGSILMARGES